MAIVRVFESPCAADRLANAAAFLRSFAASKEILVVAASRTAADDLVRTVSAETGSAFGVERASWTQLAAMAAAIPLAEQGRTPLTTMGAEAIARYAAGAAAEGQGLEYLAPLTRFPGFAAALAATINELRLAEVAPVRLHEITPELSDLAGLLRLFEKALHSMGLADRAALFDAAIEGWRSAEGRGRAERPVLLLDVDLRFPAEGRFLRQVLERTGTALATLPSGDTQTRRILDSAADIRDLGGEPARPEGGLHRLRTYLFAAESPAAAQLDEEVTFFSAPGESRETVEIARYVLDEARAGVPFDDMAVFLRNAEAYTPLLQTAFRRAGIPTFFARGTPRADASGRAFLALLACRADNLSPTRFAEYLSFGQAADPDAGAAAAAQREEWAAPEDDALGVDLATAAEGDTGESGTDDRVANEVQAPRGWEGRLVEASVRGDVGRWRRRLAGLQAEVRCHLEALRDEGAPVFRRRSLERHLQDLDRLHRLALQMVERLDGLPRKATWGDWRRRLHDLAVAALHRPRRVLSILAELEPLSVAGPVSIEEVVGVLGRRLRFLEEDSAQTRYGCVFVGPPEQARGRSFAVVFVPGLAERLFPQRPREDALLLDRLRRRLSAALPTREERGNRERLLFRLALGAARKRAYLSYPRVDIVQARPRVTSFYGLDVARALHGRVPDVEEFERAATETAHARLAWPAPRNAARAVDAVEHDLAVLRDLLTGTGTGQTDGRARYLLELNPYLARSLRTRFARWQRAAWSEFDGPVRRTPQTEAVLSAHRLAERPHTAIELQRFAACPYQFFLSAVHGFEALRPVPSAERLDPQTYARILREVQKRTLYALWKTAEGQTGDDFGRARASLLSVLAETASTYREMLAPPIAGVWEDEIATLRGDLLIWLRRLTRDAEAWRPWRVGLRFGVPDQDSAPAGSSAAGAACLPRGYLLGGGVDLVETSAAGDALRITGHRNRPSAAHRGAERPGAVVGGGEMLEPVLHALATEVLLERPVREARLLDTGRGGRITERAVVVDDRARQRAASVLETIDAALAHAFLPPAPAAGACGRCDFRVVCGPYEEERVQRKASGPLAPLRALRQLP